MGERRSASGPPNIDCCETELFFQLSPAMSDMRRAVHEGQNLFVCTKRRPSRGAALAAQMHEVMLENAAAKIFIELA